MPKLTIGMAHYRDYDGVVFTIQSIRMNNPELLKDIEFVVVDQSPDDRSGQLVKEILEGGFRHATAGCKYIAMPDPQGTSPSRQRIIESATGEYVLVCDCHVMFPPTAIPALLRYFDENPESNDLIQGPILYDDLKHFSTHWNDQWRGEMWGTWANTYKCACSDDGTVISTIIESGVARPVRMTDDHETVTECDKCGKACETGDTSVGHEQRLINAGWRPLGWVETDPAFPIPGMGLGVFAVRKAAWPGFNPYSRGFGGEEMYIHRKFRARGDQALCLPGLKWWHRFGRVEVPYNPSRFNKVRNYVLEFKEMGWDLEPVYKHFIETRLINKATWRALLKDPILTTDETGGDCGTCKTTEHVWDVHNFDQAIDDLKDNDKKWIEIADELMSIKDKVSTVTEVGRNFQTSAIAMAMEPDSLVSHQLEPSGLVDQMQEFVTYKLARTELHAHQIKSFEDSDLFLIDTDYTYLRTKEVLGRIQPYAKRFIVILGASTHRDRGEDGGPGMWQAIEEFLAEHQEWSLSKHRMVNRGMTVLVTLKEDKPQLPGKWEMMKNLTKTLAESLKDGVPKASEEVYEARLKVCNTCPQRVDNRCGSCGCYLGAKAALETSRCPILMWPGDKDEPVNTTVPPDVIVKGSVVMG
jgi:hypothetical protein